MKLLLSGGRLLRRKFADSVGMSLQRDHPLGHPDEFPVGGGVFSGLDHVANHVVVVEVGYCKLLAVRGIDVAVLCEVQAGSGFLVDGELFDDEINVFCFSSGFV